MLTRLISIFLSLLYLINLISCGGDRLPLSEKSDITSSPYSGDEVTFDETIKPIFEKRCILCHQPGINTPSVPNILNYEIAFQKKDRIFQRVVVEKTMPLAPYSESLTSEERNLIATWIQDGAIKTSKQTNSITQEQSHQNLTTSNTPALVSLTPDKIEIILNEVFKNRNLKPLDEAMYEAFLSFNYSLLYDKLGRNLITAAICDSSLTDQELSILTKQLLDRQVSPHTVFNGATPLIWAILKNYFTTAQLLIQNGAQTNFKVLPSTDPLILEYLNYTPLLLAIKKKNTDLVRTLRSYNADPQISLPDGTTAISLANQIEDKQTKETIIKLLTAKEVSMFE